MATVSCPGEKALQDSSPCWSWEGEKPPAARGLVGGGVAQDHSRKGQGLMAGRGWNPPPATISL